MEVKNFENELEVSASGGRISSQPDTISYYQGVFTNVL